MVEQNDEQLIAEQVRKRADELLQSDTQQQIEPAFIKQCLDANERGDGVLYATLNRGKYLYNTTPKDGQWMAWNGNIWVPDDKKRSFAAVEPCALEYERNAEQLSAEIAEKNITKESSEGWKISLAKKYQSRIERLRTINGAKKALDWAPVVSPEMFCREHDFNQHPMLLPVNNGVIDLQTGHLTKGRPEDRLTKALDIDYDPRADYTPFADFLDEVTGNHEVSSFLQRSFGCAITGHAYEQYIWVFIGPGRNGKGVLFSMIGSVMGPFYHEVNRGFLLEQRNEPSPGAASEHKYSLLGKRIVVGAETNKGQKIDAAAVKGLTGEDKVTCRPNFGSEISFDPTHNLFLHTNYLPHGLAQDFALVQRLLIIELPFMYVDDVAAEQRKNPRLAESFRQKDPRLKSKLMACRQGILRWLVEGTRLWIDQGISPPPSVLARVDTLKKEQDYIGEFYADCLDHFPDHDKTRIQCTAMYDAFTWWWHENRGTSDRQKMPAMKSINDGLRERGVDIEKSGGKTWIKRHTIKLDRVSDIEEFLRSRRGSKS